MNKGTTKQSIDVLWQQCHSRDPDHNSF